MFPLRGMMMVSWLPEIAHKAEPVTCVQTRNGPVYILADEQALWHPRQVGAWVRAYCPLHGGDHQRSLSIRRETGWGRCFNAGCGARVLIETWNPEMAQRLRSHLLFCQDRTPPPTPPVQSAPTAQPIPSSDWQHTELIWLQQVHPASIALLAQDQSEPLQQARRYLSSRHIPLALALAQGMGYVPMRPVGVGPQTTRHLVKRWGQRLLFPLQIPTGPGGFLGRSLHGWLPGMTEQEHQCALSQHLGTRRWLKTNPAGWMGSAFKELAPVLILVEGPFDRLALLAAGMVPERVMALGGTHLPDLWLPPHVRHVLLAFDADQAESPALLPLKARLRQRGISVSELYPPTDGLGDDWSERWRCAGHQGLAILQETVHRIF